MSRVIGWIRRESSYAVVCGVLEAHVSAHFHVARNQLRKTGSACKTMAIANSKGKWKKGANL